MKTGKSVLYFLGQYLKHTPLYLLLYLVQTVTSALLYVLNSIWLLKLAFNAFAARTAFVELLARLLAVALFDLAALAFGHWFTQVYAPRQELRLRRVVQHAVFDQAARLGLRYYDDARFYNDYILALDGSETVAQQLLQQLGDCLYNTVAILSILAILWRIDGLVVALILTAVAVSFAVDLLLSKKQAQRTFATLPLQRKLAYYERVYYLPDHIEEVKSLPDSAFLRQAQQQATQDCARLHRQKSRPLVRLYAVKGVCRSVLTSFGIYFVLVYQLAVEKSLLLGDLSAALNSVWRLSECLEKIIQSVAALYKQALYAAKLVDFLRLQPTEPGVAAGRRPAPAQAAVIQIRDLNFCYKERQQVLRNIHLTIAPGQRIAVVGQNGSGKTTLIKVLLGLYPSAGRVFLDGHPLEEYDPQQLRRYFHALFQDLQIYAVTLRENLLMDLPPAKEEEDAQKLWDVLCRVGLQSRVAALPKGVDTALLREYDPAATELSGGEKQKVALARVLLSRACVVVLDEPSSALDPLGEQQFNDLLMSAFADRTVIFISHRFFATQHADHIYLLHHGQITEDGTHAQLMALRGEYAHMYRLQQEKYQL